MAFSCVLHLKNECDGCGFCEESRHSLSRGCSSFDDDAYDPFEIDYDDER